METNRSPRGFSLFELIVYLAIFGLLITAILSIAVQSLNSKVKSQAMTEVETATRYSLERITADVRMATDIDETDLTSNTLTLTQGNGDTVRYQVTSGQLTRSLNGAAAVTLTASTVTVDDFTITNTTPSGSDANDLIVSLTTRTINNTERREYDADLTLTTALSTRL